VDVHDGPELPCEDRKKWQSGHGWTKMKYDHGRNFPGTPHAELLLDKSLCLLWKKAQGIATEISARVLAWGERTL